MNKDLKQNLKKKKIFGKEREESKRKWRRWRRINIGNYALLSTLITGSLTEFISMLRRINLNVSISQLWNNQLTTKLPTIFTIHPSLLPGFFGIPPESGRRNIPTVKIIIGNQIGFDPHGRSRSISGVCHAIQYANICKSTQRNCAIGVEDIRTCRWSIRRAPGRGNGWTVPISRGCTSSQPRTSGADAKCTCPVEADRTDIVYINQQHQVLSNDSMIQIDLIRSICDH